MLISSTPAQRPRLPLGGLLLLLALTACDPAEPAGSDPLGVGADGLGAFMVGSPFDGPFDGGDLAFTTAGAPVRAGADDLVCHGTYGAITVDNVIVPDDARCRLNGTRVDGTVFVYTRAVLLASGIVVGGNVQSDGHTGVVLRDLDGRRSFVDGDVQIDQGGKAGVGRTTIGGNLQMEQNTGELLIAYNRIGGNLQVNQNTGGVRIVRNVVAQSMQCQANSPPPTGFGNQAGDKEDQCANL